MRLALLPLLLLAACANEGTTRNYSLLRDAAPETMAATQPPLSAPPGLALRPARPNPLGDVQSSQPGVEPTAGSAGQNALLEAAGPAAEPDIRKVINENSGLVYPGPAFVEQVMGWTPPPGSTPLFTQASRGWFSRLF